MNTCSGSVAIREIQQKYKEKPQSGACSPRFELSSRKPQVSITGQASRERSSNPAGGEGEWDKLEQAHTKQCGDFADI